MSVGLMHLMYYRNVRPRGGRHSRGQDFPCYIFPVTEPRRGPGRPPKEGGPKPHRQIRVGQVWDDAYDAAKAMGVPFAVFVERALTAELKRMRRRQKRDQRDG